MGLHKEAIRSLERALRMSPVDHQLHQALGAMAMAFVELNRFEEALAAKRAQRQNPSYSTPYLCLASAFAHLRREAEASEAAARLLEHDPSFTISRRFARGAQENAKLLIEALRKAGLPE